MSRSLGWFLALGLAATACDAGPAEPRVELAALADLATRQIIAGLNAENREVLGGLAVITSTAGGAPRPLTRDELTRLVFPPGPYEYLGAGRPGSMILLDGKREKRRLRLVRSGSSFRALVRSVPLAAYAGAGAVVSDARVFVLFPTEPEP